MVILNAFIGVILKLASVYASIFDLVNFIFALFNPDGLSINMINASLNVIIICSEDETCFLIEDFANLFYLISLSIYLIFFYHFDKNFRTSFLRLFNDKKKNTKNNALITSEYSTAVFENN